jgi:putative SOS response-associated peptidase YedK
MVNARSERVLGEGWSVWKGIRHQRCLVPAMGFFEHKEIAGRKQPYYIHVKDAAVFFIAGLYHYSPVPDVETGECKGTFTLLTQPSNELLTEIHNSGENRHRMPVMLQPDTLRLWLDPQLADKKMQELLHTKIPAASLEAWPVRSIRQAKEDNQKVIEPIEVSDQASLF